MTIKTVEFNSLRSGPTFVVTGSVHGDERCGPVAINKIIDDLDNGRLELICGTLICIPIANPRAYAKNVRYIDRNLNRHLYPKDSFEHYEDHLTPILCHALAQADVLLDLHSYASAGGPFIFLGPGNPKEQAYARHLGINDFIYGWQDAYGTGDSKEYMGTTEYTRTQGGMAITLECGHHFNANNADIGYHAIHNALAHFKLIDAQAHTPDYSQQRAIKMKHVYYKEHPGRFTQAWQHLDFLEKDQPIATYDNGTSLTAPEDCYIVLPKTEPPLNTEWFYLGVNSDFPV